MLRYKQILVGLSFTNMDASTIQYAAKVSRMARSEKIYFVHVAPNPEIPDSIRTEFPELGEPIDDSAQASLRELVKTHFVNANPETDLEFQDQNILIRSNF